MKHEQNNIEHYTIIEFRKTLAGDVKHALICGTKNKKMALKLFTERVGGCYYIAKLFQLELPQELYTEKFRQQFSEVIEQDYLCNLYDNEWKLTDKNKRLTMREILQLRNVCNIKIKE